MVYSVDKPPMNVEGAFRLTSRSGWEEAVDQGIGGRVVNAGLYHYRINVRGRVPASNAQNRVVFADADGGDISGSKDRKSVVEGTSVSILVDIGWLRSIKKKKP